jgi:hypothetical protein
MKSIFSNGMAVAAAIFMAIAETSLADSIADLEQAYLSRYDEAIGKQKSQIEKLQASYLTALKREMAKVQSTGKLEAVIPFRDEITFIEEGKDPLPALPEATVYQLKKMRSQFVDARQSILVTNATILVGLADKMVEVLEARETELTKAGKIDEALAAKKMRESYVEDENIQASRNILKFVGAGGETAAAMRIRRSGDNIEVLVRYDSKGKISMDSPVENVKEETAGGGEKGETKAKVLGEFVGANGYEVDPWVAYHQVFDEKAASQLVISDLDVKPGHQAEGGVGSKVSYKSGAKNPFISFGDVLPSSRTGGEFLISVKYFIPQNNRVVSGFRFIHVIGSPIGGKQFQKTGSWETEEVISGPSNEGTKLLWYLSTVAGKTSSDAKDDFVVLGEVKVVYTKFSAYIQSQYGEKGEVKLEFADPTKQPKVIGGGDFEDKKNPMGIYSK